MSALPPPLSASRAVSVPIVHLSLSLCALLFTSLLILVESRLYPTPPRLLVSVIPPPPPPPKRRSRALLAALRLLLAVSLAASLLLAALPAVRLISAAPAAAVAPDRPNRWAHALVRRAILRHAADLAAAGVDPPPLPARVGLGPRALAADADSDPKILWVLLLLLVVAVSLAGAVAAPLAERLPMKIPVAVIIFVQALVWLVTAIPAALVIPTKLPLDAAPLEMHWLDRVYSNDPADVNETRFLANWYLAMRDGDADDGETIVPLQQYARIEDAFCDQFTLLAPKTGSEVAAGGDDDDDDDDNDDDDDDDAVLEERLLERGATPSTLTHPNAAATTPIAGLKRQDEGNDAQTNVPSPDSISIESLSRDDFAEVILAYLIGKPTGRDQYRILSYMALGAMVGAPVLVGQFCKTWLLYLFVAAWAAVWFVIALLATPSVLRILAAPVKGTQVFTVCGVFYAVSVSDSTTRLIGRLDAAFFAVVLLVGLLQGFRWKRLGDRFLHAKALKEEKTVSAEETRSGSGTLKW